jgi:hypothetical protein
MMADLDRNMQHTEEKVLFPMTVFCFTNRQLQFLYAMPGEKLVHFNSKNKNAGTVSLAVITPRYSYMHWSHFVLQPALSLSRHLVVCPQNMATKEVPSISLDVQGSPLQQQQQQQPVPYKLYKRRWPILFIFVLYSMSNAMQWTQYAIINDIITTYYGVDSYAVSWTSMVYMTTYLLLIFPGSWFLDKKVLQFISNAFHC